MGREGKPLKQVLEYAVKGLGLLKPEPLLHHLLERGLTPRGPSVSLVLIGGFILAMLSSEEREE